MRKNWLFDLGNCALFMKYLITNLPDNKIEIWEKKEIRKALDPCARRKARSLLRCGRPTDRGHQAFGWARHDSCDSVALRRSLKVFVRSLFLYLGRPSWSVQTQTHSHATSPPSRGHLLRPGRANSLLDHLTKRSVTRINVKRRHLSFLPIPLTHNIDFFNLSSISNSK